MKRVCCLLFALLLLSLTGCVSFDRFMNTLEGNWRNYDIDPDSVTELIIYAPDKPELLSVTDQAEIHAFLSKAKQFSIHTIESFDDAPYVIAIYGNDCLLDLIPGGIPSLYNLSFANAANQLYEKMEQTEADAYQYSITIPQGLFYDDAASYLENLGYSIRHTCSAGRYPSLRISYPVLQDDLNGYTGDEPKRPHGVGEIAIDDRLYRFLDELQKEDMTHPSFDPSKSQVYGIQMQYSGNTLLSVERGIRYVPLAHFLTEREISFWKQCAAEATLTLEYHEPYSDISLLLISDHPLEETQLSVIHDGLSSLAG